jgi:hypothetical protein
VHQRLPILGTRPQVFADLIDRRGDVGCGCGSASQRVPGDSQKPLPYFQPESHRTPHGFPENGDFSDPFRDAPYTGGPGWEESQIAGAQPSFFAFLVCDEDLAGDYHNSLIHAVLALEASGRALPYNNVRGQVMASHHVPGPRYRGAAQNPPG